MTVNPFIAAISKEFGKETGDKVAESFSELGLPLPESKAEFMDGNEGFLVFLSPYAMTLRIEPAKPHAGEYLRHPNILQPIISHDVGKAVLEVSPSVAIDDCSDEDVQNLKSKLYDDGVFFWDDEVRNIGKLPIETAEFPDGIPVVIDRLSVERVSHSPSLLEMEYPEKFSQNPNPIYDDTIAMEEQDSLYKPLKEAFAEVEANKGQPSAYKASMLAFWDKCQELKADGVTIAQWDDKAFFGENKPHPRSVRKSAEAYHQTLKNHKP